MLRKEKPIGMRNGLKIYKPLQAKTKLKSGKRMNTTSEKQKTINRTWKQSTDQRYIQTGGKCEWCGKEAIRQDLDGHHKIPRRYNIHTVENCYVVHRLEHQLIHDKGIDVTQTPNKLEWEKQKLGGGEK